MSGPSGRPIDLRVERESDPSNVATDRPRFSWRVDRDDGEQSAYRLLVARDRETLAGDVGDVWDSGMVASSRSVEVEYDGAPLAADATYFWKVRVRNADGEVTPYSDPARFGTALGDASDWAGSWIGHQPGNGDSAGYRSDWQPADEATEQWVQVDLGDLREFESVHLAPAVAAAVPTTPDGGPVRGQFGFPTGYRIEAATDPAFEDARVLVEVLDDDGGDTRRFDVGPTAARYVRVTATDQHVVDPIRDSYRENDVRVGVDHRPWAVFALSALSVRDGSGTDLALGRPVRASSSHEGGPWGRDRLVDGTEGLHDASASPLLRTEFSLAEPIRSARVHVAAVGYGECYVNGEKAGDAVLDPGWTTYQDRVLYRTYDVSDALSAGENALGLWLGRGWFSKWGRGSPRARAHLTVEYEDGTTHTIGTSQSWRATESPIVANDIYDGETYDARRERTGWAEPGFDDRDWDQASEVPAPGGELRPQRTPPIRVTETLDPDEIRDHEDGPIVDFGQNHTGWIEIDVSDAEAGDEITLRHAEALTDDGDLSTTDLRSADATDTYVASGDERGTYEPRFTYHGYRYAQIDGYPGELTAEDVTAKVVHTDFDSVGSFDCANDDVARVQRNSRWGLRSNAHSVPTDCPQRNERLGWTGDAQLAGRALMYNFDATRFHEKWMRDHDDAQSSAGHLPPVVPPRHRLRVSDPSWTVTRVVIPWYLYLHYGDERVLEDHYEAMCRYVDYWHSVAEDGIVPEKYGSYGDWLAFENNEGRHGLPYDLFNTAFHYRTTNLVGRIAGALGYEADAERYGERAAAIAEAFNDRYFDEAANAYEPGTQAAFAMPLFLGIVPDDAVDEVVANLAAKIREEDDGRLRTGFLGTRALIHALADHGEADLAYEIVSQPERPGWVYMVRQGATTVWERWDSDDQVGSGMNSLNHSPFTLVSEWFYRALAGIRIDEDVPRERTFTIAPAFVDDLEWARGSVDTPYGTVASAWERTADGVDLEVTIPWNASGVIRLPADAARVAVDGTVVREGTTTLPDGVESVTSTGAGALELAVAAGEYDVEIVG